MNIQDLWSDMLNFFGKAWWVEITTDRPHCIYYFGPFATKHQADLTQSGYIDDLASESAEVTQVIIKRGKPVELTIYDESEDVHLPIDRHPWQEQMG
jgi:hypothetical protein